MRGEACAKVNIFLKITGTKGTYHTLSSRFMRVPSLCDTLRFVPRDKEEATPFRLEGAFGCALERNTIYRAYRLLCEEGYEESMRDFFARHSVVVEKRIPEFAGLGGGSSDAATFLMMCNDTLKLTLGTEELIEIGVRIGADLPFFLSGYASANVFGIGEVVEPFEEEPLDLELFTPQDVRCDTGEVYRRYKGPMQPKLAQKMCTLHSYELLERYDATTLNDLLTPALELCPKLRTQLRPGWFFSGSGSSLFRRRDG